MAVAQPDILLVLNDSSGTTVTNDGTVATDASVGHGVENTDWAWHPGEGSLNGWWESLDQDGSDQAWITMTGIALSNTLTHLWSALAFNITSWDTRASSRGYIIGGTNTNEVAGGLVFRVGAPTSTGDFDLTVFCRDISFSIEQTITFADLSFSTDYSIVAALDATTASAHVLKAKLDSGSVQSSASANRTGGAVWGNNGGYIGRSIDYTNYYGFIGKVYFYAHDRGVLLSDADMASINSDPSIITGWPGGGGGGGLSIPVANQHLRNIGMRAARHPIVSDGPMGILMPRRKLLHLPPEKRLILSKVA